MPKYKVTIQRTEFRSHTFEVDADNRSEAEEAAETASCDYDWHDSPIGAAHEDVISVQKGDD
jgi:hypothetical protein